MKVLKLNKAQISTALFEYAERQGIKPNRKSGAKLIGRVGKDRKIHAEIELK